MKKSLLLFICGELCVGKCIHGPGRTVGLVCDGKMMLVETGGEEIQVVCAILWIKVSFRLTGGKHAGRI